MDPTRVALNQRVSFFTDSLTGYDVPLIQVLLILGDRVNDICNKQEVAHEVLGGCCDYFLQSLMGKSKEIHASDLAFQQEIVIDTKSKQMGKPDPTLPRLDINLKTADVQQTAISLGGLAVEAARRHEKIQVAV